MNLYAVDWYIIICVVVVLLAIGVIANRYTKSVCDFLAANRCGGRYLLAMAEGMAGMGAITIIANFEKFYQSGFAAAWWGSMIAPVTLLITLSGWVIYRFRQTRALTMAQFFEMRYSRRFRVFTGMLAWVSGIINYGIFPAVTARFFIYFCGLPQYYVNIGSLELDLTMGGVMFIMLFIAVMLTFMGGQIAVMISDFMQGQFVNLVFLIIMICLFLKFGWSNIVDTLKQVPAGKSMMNPFDQGEIPDFTFSFFAIQAFIAFYAYMGWQGIQGYYCSAKNPHEARMARILGTWRGGVTYLMIMIIPIAAYVLLHNDSFSAESGAVTQTLSGIADEQVREQVTVPIALTQMLPPGVLGLFAAAMFMAAVSTDDTYLHSWGSIFIQDVILPLRKKPLSAKQHIRWLRISIISVSIFAWTFSMLFPLKDYIWMFFAITGAIYLGGAGSVIVGGLYWKRGTTAGAWAGMTSGSIVAVVGIVLRNIFWPYILPSLAENNKDGFWAGLPEKFPLDGMELSFIAAAVAIVCYVVFSLLTKVDPDFDMDKMLHRGKYSADAEPKHGPSPVRGLRALGITDEFTRTDKIIYFFTLGWTIFWFATFIIGTIWCMSSESTEDGWAMWWGIRIGVMIVVGVLTIVWFLWGGVRNLIEMLKMLGQARRNEFDDGRVEGHQNLADMVEEK